MKKKVLMVSFAELGRSGVSSIIMQLCRQFSSEYTFDVVTLTEATGVFDEEFRQYGGEIFRFRVRRYEENRVLFPLSFFQMKSQFQRLLKTHKYDIIHCHCGYYDGVFLWLARKAGIGKRISHAHGTYDWKGINFIMRAYLRICKELIRRNATVRLACSDIAGKTLFLGKEYSNVLNPIDASYYAAVKRSEKKGIGLIQIGYFCRLKNQLFSLALMQKLLRDGMDVRLDFIGYPNEDGYYERMRAFVEENGLGAYVQVLPQDADKVQAFSNADYCLLPSVSEGLPLVALESQAARVVCLMSDHISTNADIGAARFLAHDDIDVWAEQIKAGAEIDTVRLEDNLNRYSVKNYMDRFKTTYEAD